MRKGTNPNWKKPVDITPADVTAVIVVHIPHLGGYYSDMLRVLDRCLASVRTAGQDIDVLVHANGCCAAALDVIKSNRPDYLIQTRRNIGAINALFQAVRATPGQVIAYSDYDVDYLPGWLDPQLQILEAYNAGMVSGNPAGWSAEHCNRSADKLPGKWIKRDLELERRHAQSLGWRNKTLEDRLNSGTKKKNRDLWFTDQAGVPAIVGARHYQFIAYRDRLLKIDPGWWPLKMEGHTDVLDKAIDSQGWLRLCTPDPWVYHLGNVLDSDVV